MRDDRVSTNARWLLVLGMVTGWLVVQNAALLVLWSWPVLPAMWTVARVLLKVGGWMAVQLSPAALVAVGAWLLWASYGGSSTPDRPQLEEVRHG